MKHIDYYIQKREEARARIVQIEKFLSTSNRDVRWKYYGDRIRAERSAINNDIKGYSCIIAHLESGIDISRYQNKEYAYAILERERREHGNG